jgi:cellulose synthase/poly-beta-1,6-N-acetylglucosamine synthase-like glycosyltransferase
VALQLLFTAGNMEHSIARACFAVVALSLSALIYVYAGFPLLLAALTSWKRRYAPPEEQPDERLPSVSLIVAAHNEELVIKDKIRNSLAVDYPPDKLEFLFVSDSTDRTNGILEACPNPRVRALILPERRGKVHAVNVAVQASRGEILVFSDANTFYRTDAIRKLVRHFQNPEVGVATGDVRILASKETFGAGEGLYYRYERTLQSLETDFWSTVATDGAMYAVRASQLTGALVTNGCVDDVATAMNVARAGFRIIYDPAAIAEEPPTPTSELEFRRKVRVVAYAIQSLLHGQGAPRLRQAGWRPSHPPGGVGRLRSFPPPPPPLSPVLRQSRGAAGRAAGPIPPFGYARRLPCLEDC